MRNIFKKLHIGSNHESNRTNETLASTTSCATDHNRTSSSSSNAAPPSPSESAATAASSPAPVVSSGGRTDYITSEEEFQVQLAMAISASSSNPEDFSEKDQIRAATLLSLNNRRSDLGRDKADVAAEVLSRQYWVIVLELNSSEFSCLPFLILLCVIHFILLT